MKTIEQTMESKYTVPVGEVLFRRVANEGVLLHLPTGTYYSLNETSILFWEAISNGTPLELTIDQITDEYDVDRSHVIDDLQEFLMDLQSYGLIFQDSN